MDPWVLGSSGPQVLRSPGPWVPGPRVSGSSVYSLPFKEAADLLGFVEVPLDFIPAEKLGLQELEKQLPLEGSPGRISIRAELGWEAKM